MINSAQSGQKDAIRNVIDTPERPIAAQSAATAKSSPALLNPTMIAPNPYRTLHGTGNRGADYLKCMAIGDFVLGQTRCAPAPKTGILPVLARKTVAYGAGRSWPLRTAVTLE
jgi:hypothetical protein